MKITCISHSSSLTGAPKIIFQIAKRLAAKHEVTLITKEDGPLFEELLKENININCHNTNTAYSVCKLSLLEKVELAKAFLEKERPDLVYANSAESSEWIIAARMLQIKNIFHLHEMKDGLTSALKTRCISLDIMNYVDVLICVSKDVERDIYEVLPIKPQKCIIQENFFECDKILEFAKTYHSPPKNASGQTLQTTKPIVCACGVASYRKGVDIFFNVARQLPDIQFIWIGKWSFEDRSLGEQTPSYESLNNFYTTGEVNNPYYYLGISDLLLLTSREDPNPLVVIEALVLGKQVVCFTETGGSRFVLDQWGYVLWGKPDAQVLASVVQRIISSSAHSSDWLARVSGSVRRTYDVEFVFPQFEKIITELVPLT